VILLQAVAFSAIVGFLRGGRLSPLLALPLRWPAVPLLCYAGQAVVLRLGAPRTTGFDLPALALLCSNLVLLRMAVVNRRLAGMALLGLGLLLNLVVMLANGGYMPIAPETMARIGYDNAGALPAGTRLVGYKDVVLPGEQTVLAVLSDVLVLPPPFAPSAFSIGDILIAAGGFLVVQWVLLAPLPDRRRPAPVRAKGRLRDVLQAMPRAAAPCDSSGDRAA
jgi:hypothetical protein